jgi:hypothetical protein
LVDETEEWFLFDGEICEVEVFDDVVEGLVLVVDGLHFDELEDGPLDLDEVLFVLVSELHLLDFLGDQFSSGAFQQLDQRI